MLPCFILFDVTINNMKLAWVGLGIVSLVVFLSVSFYLLKSGTIDAPYSQSASGEISRTNVTITQIDILASSAQPSLAFLVIKGELPNSCSLLSDPVINKQGLQVNVTLMATQPSDVDCLFETSTFEEAVELDVSEWSLGTYTILVNGTIEHKLHLPFDN